MVFQIDDLRFKIGISLCFSVSLCLRGN